MELLANKQRMRKQINRKNVHKSQNNIVVMQQHSRPQLGEA